MLVIADYIIWTQPLIIDGRLYDLCYKPNHLYVRYINFAAIRHTYSLRLNAQLIVYFLTIDSQVRKLYSRHKEKALVV